jgi:hypothetical protein
MVSRFVKQSRIVLMAAIVSAAAAAQINPSPIDLVRATVSAEVAAANDHSAKHMFRDDKKTPQGSQTRIYVETTQAMAGMTVAYNHKPLSGDQLQRTPGKGRG